MASRVLASMRQTKRISSNDVLQNSFRTISTTYTLKESKGKHVPYGERGSSNYSLATRGCFDVMHQATPMVLNCIERLIATRNHQGISSTPFVIADIGTADGGTSIPLMHDIIAMIRRDRNHSNTPIQICYEDQADNDWNSLLNNIQNRNDNKIGIDPASYFLNGSFNNIFVSLCGSSFYEQCFVADSLDFVFSSTAMHWLSSIPCSMSDVLHSAMSEDDEKRKYAEQAALDWNVILKHRSNELKDYGQMVIINFCIDSNGQYLGNTFMDGRDTVNVHELFRNLWKSIVDEEEFVNTNFVNHYRTLDELANFDTNIRLKLTDLESHCVECPFFRDLMDETNDDEQSNRIGYAAKYVPTLRTWSNSTFMSGLNHKRNVIEKQEMVDNLFTEYSRHVERAPHQHRMDYIHGYAMFESTK